MDKKIKEMDFSFVYERDLSAISQTKPSYAAPLISIQALSDIFCYRG